MQQAASTETVRRVYAKVLRLAKAYKTSARGARNFVNLSKDDRIDLFIDDYLPIWYLRYKQIDPNTEEFRLFLGLILHKWRAQKSQIS